MGRGKLKIKPVQEKKPLITKAEISNWTMEQFDEFFVFLDFFYDPDTGKRKVTYETSESLAQYKSCSTFLSEMYEKVKVDWGYTNAKMKCGGKITMLEMFVNQVILENPQLISPLTIGKNKVKMQYIWLNEYFDVENKFIVSEVRRAEKVEEAIQSLTTTMPATPESGPSSTLIEAMGKVAQVYLQIANSITTEEIKKMKVTDKIGALQKLSYIHTTTRKFKPNMNFIKINTKSGSAEELEAALLDFSNDEPTSE